MIALLRSQKFHQSKLKKDIFQNILSEVRVSGGDYSYYDLQKLKGHQQIDRLPDTIKILLESSIRNNQKYTDPMKVVESILNWQAQSQNFLIPFRPTRFLLQDFKSHLKMALKLSDAASVQFKKDSKNLSYPDNHEASNEYEINKIKQQTYKSFFDKNNIKNPEASKFWKSKVKFSADFLLEKEQKRIFPGSLVKTLHSPLASNGLGLLSLDITNQSISTLLKKDYYQLNLPKVIGIRLTGQLLQNTSISNLIVVLGGICKQQFFQNTFIQFFGPGVKSIKLNNRTILANAAPFFGAKIAYFPIDDQVLNFFPQNQDQKKLKKTIFQSLGINSQADRQDKIKYSHTIEINLSNLNELKENYSIDKKFFLGEKLNCKELSQQIKGFVKSEIQKLGCSLKITVVLSNGADGKPLAASQIYVKNKLKLMADLGIQSKLINVNPDLKEEQMIDLIESLNKDPSNTSTMIQLPFPPQYTFNIHKVLNRIDSQKNIDGFAYTDTLKPNYNNPNTFKPPTVLGILALINYFGINTIGKNVAIIGKGNLVGAPLSSLLKQYPYYSTVGGGDVFTQDLQKITDQADIIVAACGVPQFVKSKDVQIGSVLIDVGINEIPADKDTPEKKRKITGDISKEAYLKCKYYTSVPGGVGLLTVAALAFNVLNAYRLQKSLSPLSLEQEMKNRSKLNKFIKKSQKKTEDIKIMLISSAYNGLTQRIDKSLKTKGYAVEFVAATTDQNMRNGVNQFKPDIIICPTLMKAIPEDIYNRIKCIIVHPGIKGDRGPSSIDWAILNKNQEWGVTLLEADKQMDAGDIWATQNYGITASQSKVQIYNTEVSRVAEKLVYEVLDNFRNKDFKPEKLNYQNPLVKGNLHRTIKQSDFERSVNWLKQSTAEILIKSQAAETQPGLKVELIIGDKSFKCFTYGYVEEKNIKVPSNIKPGEIFSRKYEAVCVKTMDGAVWVKQIRRPKNKDNPYTFKVPSTILLGQEMLSNIHHADEAVFSTPSSDTFEEITFEKKGEIGVLGFDFYNGAMSTSQCHRLASAVKQVAQMNDIKIVIFAGSKRNWSNGIHLNVIEYSKDPKQQSWQNIKGINEIIKNVYGMSDKLTISAIQASAGAGGVYMGLASDYCFARQGIVLNPHYKNMGLYGSELHTATAIRKFGNSILRYMKEQAQPLLVEEAIELGVLDQLEKDEKSQFLDRVFSFAEKLLPQFNVIKAQKNEVINSMFTYKTLNEYEYEQLEEMKKDMFEDRYGFAKKRFEFVNKL